MDSISHYRKAEELSRVADQLLAGYAHDITLEEARAWAQAAQVHATLALAAVNALASPGVGLPFDDQNAWFAATSVAAPIAPETDDENAS